jgi:hypothetical protein
MQAAVGALLFSCLALQVLLLASTHAARVVYS